MSSAPRTQLDDIRLVIVTIINREQDRHSKLLSDLKVIEGTEEFSSAVSVLSAVYREKSILLNEILSEIERLKKK